MPAQPASPVTGDKWPTFWAAVEAVFPGICPDHVRRLAPNHDWEPARFIAHTLDQQEAGYSYPTRATTQKRKRSEERGDDEAGLLDQMKKQSSEFALKRQARREEGFYYHASYARATFFLLQIAFPRLYVKDIQTMFKEKQSCLYPTYLALKEELDKPEQERRFGSKEGRSKPAASPTDVHSHIKRSSQMDAATQWQAEEEALAEFNAVHSLFAAKAERNVTSREGIEAKAEIERFNEQQANADGAMGECGCCFSDVPLNRRVHCTGDTPHYVCFECAKAYAKSKVGMSQWEINCFSVENCPGTFSLDQRALFLDDKLTAALDRLEQDQALRDAGIENLAHCPFCPYAAEYPPVEVNKEFVCHNPDCGAVTCRLCKGPTHIPKSCEEVRSETAAEYARHQIEEDMTHALIRKCNHCKTPYLKLDGCNKIACSKCGTRQCYICQQTIKDYDHFRDPKTPCYQRLHDSMEGQMALDVETAEKEARAKILKENSHIREQHLGFNFSETVQREDERQRAHAQAAARQRNRAARAEGQHLFMEMLEARRRQEAREIAARRARRVAQLTAEIAAHQQAAVQRIQPVAIPQRYGVLAQPGNLDGLPQPAPAAAMPNWVGQPHPNPFAQVPHGVQAPHMAPWMAPAVVQFFHAPVAMGGIAVPQAGGQGLPNNGLPAPRGIRGLAPPGRPEIIDLTGDDALQQQLRQPPAAHQPFRVGNAIPGL